MAIMRKSSRSRTVLVVLGIVLVVLGLVGGVPSIATHMKFQESKLRGQSPTEVIARCGHPDIVLLSGEADRHGALPRGGLWPSISEADRASLLASSEFLMHYMNGWRDDAVVHFKAGRAVRITFGGAR